MEASGRQPEGKQRIYCVVPRELAPKLHEPLRKHFRDDPAVEVIVERRSGERRREGERRNAKGGGQASGRERRAVRSRAGRRAGERRAPLTDAEPRELPRRARPHADRIRFLQRLEPSQQEHEDDDTARLIARAQAGEDDAFGVVYLRYFERVYNYLNVALDDHDEAEDKTQQTFLNILEALPGYRPRGPFRAYLFTVARNLAVDHLRAHGRVTVEDPEEVARMIDAEAAEAPQESLSVLDWISDPELLMLFERLPLPQRQVLVMRYTLGFTSRETAGVLGRTEASVRMLQSRAEAFLRERLIALGRDPETGERARSRSWHRPAPVLRARRFSLTDNGPSR